MSARPPLVNNASNAQISTLGMVPGSRRQGGGNKGSALDTMSKLGGRADGVDSEWGESQAEKGASAMMPARMKKVSGLSGLATINNDLNKTTSRMNKGARGGLSGAAGTISGLGSNGETPIQRVAKNNLMNSTQNSINQAMDANYEE